MKIDTALELKRIDTYLDTIESVHDSAFCATVTEFVYQNILDESNPVTYQVAANYLLWALQKPNLVGRKGFETKCICSFGWRIKDDGAAFPCERCRPEQHEKWWVEYVDDSSPPT